MKCRVTICGAEGGEIRCPGQLNSEGDKFELTYIMNGDNCSLYGSGISLVQSRRGSFNTDITFVRGKETVCAFDDGRFSGAIPVKTYTLEVIPSEYGIFVEISYELGGERIVLRLNAEYV